MTYQTKHIFAIYLRLESISNRTQIEDVFSPYKKTIWTLGFILRKKRSNDKLKLIVCSIKQEYPEENKRAPFLMPDCYRKFTHQISSS